MRPPRAHVTDHAVLRYLERVLKLDVEGHRRTIGKLVENAAAQGASGVIVDGMRYCLLRDTCLPVVVTVRKAGAPDIRRGRKAARKPGPKPQGRGPGA